MGFVRQDNVYVLDFEDTELDGLTVRAGRCSFDEYIAIGRALDRPMSGLDDFARDVAELQDLVIPKLISWDLEEKGGTPIPLTLEYIRAQDKQFQLALYNAYRYAITVVPRPLEKPSGSGGPSPAASLPMEVLSPSLSS
jgi:hypothetical protein